jgi:hypothetical protein
VTCHAGFPGVANSKKEKEMRRTLTVFGMVALVFAMILVVTAPASAQNWSGNATAGGGTETWGNFSQGSWSGGDCGHYCGGRSSGASVSNSTGNEAWVKGRGREQTVDAVRFGAKASRTDDYVNDVRTRGGGIFTSGTGTVNVNVRGKSR